MRIEEMTMVPSWKVEGTFNFTVGKKVCVFINLFHGPISRDRKK